MCYRFSVDIPDKNDRKKYPDSGENEIEIGMKRSDQSAGKRELYKMNQVLDNYRRQSDSQSYQGAEDKHQLPVTNVFDPHEQETLQDIESSHLKRLIIRILYNTFKHADFWLPSF
jgi:hypothetical protein